MPEREKKRLPSSSTALNLRSSLVECLNDFFCFIPPLFLTVEM